LALIECAVESSKLVWLSSKRISHLLYRTAGHLLCHDESAIGIGDPADRTHQHDALHQDLTAREGVADVVAACDPLGHDGQVLIADDLVILGALKAFS
jgi:hypothetical protein